jgi:hypothetical protein
MSKSHVKVLERKKGEHTKLHHKFGKWLINYTQLQRAPLYSRRSMYKSSFEYGQKLFSISIHWISFCSSDSTRQANGEAAAEICYVE